MTPICHRCPSNFTKAKQEQENLEAREYYFKCNARYDGYKEEDTVHTQQPVVLQRCLGNQCALWVPNKDDPWKGVCADNLSAKPWLDPNYKDKNDSY